MSSGEQAGGADDVKRRGRAARNVFDKSNHYRAHDTAGLPHRINQRDFPAAPASSLGSNAQNVGIEAMMPAPSCASATIRKPCGWQNARTEKNDRTDTRLISPAVGTS